MATRGIVGRLGRLERLVTQQLCREEHRQIAVLFPGDPEPEVEGCPACEQPLVPLIVRIVVVPDRESPPRD